MVFVCLFIVDLYLEIFYTIVSTEKKYLISLDI